MKGTEIGAVVSVSSLNLGRVRRASRIFHVKTVYALHRLRRRRKLEGFCKSKVTRDLHRVIKIRFEGRTAIKNDVCKECKFSSILATLLTLSAFIRLCGNKAIQLSRFMGEGTSGSVLMSMVIEGDGEGFHCRSVHRAGASFPILAYSIMAKVCENRRS